MKLLLKSVYEKSQCQLSEYERQEEASDFKAPVLSSLNDDALVRLNLEHLMQSRENIQGLVDELSLALMKITAAIETNKLLNEEDNPWFYDVS